MKKVLILSCNTGEGHNSAAHAVCEALHDSGVECEVADALQFAGKKQSDLVSNSYNSIVVHAPAIFGLAYTAGDIYSTTKLPSPVYLANTLHAKQLGEYIRNKGFTVAICSHLFPMETLTFLRSRHEIEIPCYAVLTDYTCIPFLEETDMDLYFLPHDDLIAECIESGIAENRLITTGLPVAKRYVSRMTRCNARNFLVIPTDKKMYLVMTGGLGSGNVKDLCNEILRDKGDNIVIFVLTGRNSDLKANLEKLYKNDDRVQIMTFTEIVNIYMCAADVLISKPGGISSTEAAVVNVPLVLAMAIPGCETKNAKFFEEHGMALSAGSVEEAAQYADLLVDFENIAEAMCVAQREHIDPHGAVHIARFVSAL
ncbi:MAG TPA: glycosyltransferase [Negativicutes bacterium]|nr:glycosyltransferase [Negativicutes bacterium]